jgi:NAD(P)-dependent dehydrogenase (short-subunit alcohol dehydrogenase family)
VAIDSAVRETVSRFGGIDVVVSNAGIFTAGATIAEMDEEAWARSMDVNLSSAMLLLRASTPFLALGVDPAVVIVGSKNVPAPGRAAAAYSVAKAGLTQLARVAALELADSGVRVNTVHPNAVFDTGIWTEEVLAGRAVRYGMTVEEYKKSNLLGVEVGSADVARMVTAMAGPLFAKTTGAQVPVDGGTERVV